MTTLFNKFNFDPVSTTLKTTSYTVPSGKYALAFPGISAGSSETLTSTLTFTTPGTVTLNGTILFYVDYSANIVGSGITGTFPSGYPKKIYFNAVATTTNPVVTFSTNGGTNVNLVNAGGGVGSGVIFVNSGNVGLTNASCSLYIEDVRKEKYRCGIWVKAGDVLAGTNAANSAFEWTVIEYNSFPS
jgi:hypothetical protein